MRWGFTFAGGPDRESWDEEEVVFAQWIRRGVCNSRAPYRLDLVPRRPYRCVVLRNAYPHGNMYLNGAISPNKSNRGPWGVDSPEEYHHAITRAQLI